jgi:hypothetical protein
MSSLTALPLTPVLVQLSRLAQEFRDNQREALRLGASEEAANVWQAAAKELEKRTADSLLEPLTLDGAALESGYTRNHLNRMLRDGKVPNSGTDTDPRILRKHLPRKPGFGIDERPLRPASSRVQAARAVIEGED